MEGNSLQDSSCLTDASKVGVFSANLLAKMNLLRAPGGQHFLLENAEEQRNFKPVSHSQGAVLPPCLRFNQREAETAEDFLMNAVLHSNSRQHTERVHAPNVIAGISGDSGHHLYASQALLDENSVYYRETAEKYRRLVSTGEKIGQILSSERSRKYVLRKTTMCKYWQRGMCSKENCNFAHGEKELMSTPDVWKTTVCRNWKAGNCKGGIYCRHAHGELELRQSVMSSETFAFSSNDVDTKNKFRSSKNRKGKKKGAKKASITTAGSAETMLGEELISAPSDTAGMASIKWQPPAGTNMSNLEKELQLLFSELTLSPEASHRDFFPKTNEELVRHETLQTSPLLPNQNSPNPPFLPEDESLRLRAAYQLAQDLMLRTPSLLSESYRPTGSTLKISPKLMPSPSVQPISSIPQNFSFFPAADARRWVEPIGAAPIANTPSPPFIFPSFESTDLKSLFCMEGLDPQSSNTLGRGDTMGSGEFLQPSSFHTESDNSTLARGDTMRSGEFLQPSFHTLYHPKRTSSSSSVGFDVLTTQETQQKHLNLQMKSNCNSNSAENWKVMKNLRILSTSEAFDRMESGVSVEESEDLLSEEALKMRGTRSFEQACDIIRESDASNNSLLRSRSCDFPMISQNSWEGAEVYKNEVGNMSLDDAVRGLMLMIENYQGSSGKKGE